MLAGEAKCIRAIGPAPFDGTWALFDIYDGAEQLRNAGKNVIVAWIKGHRRTAGREGNHQADEAAEGALRSQIVACLWKGVATELPSWVQSLDGDAREEALWRLSKQFFRWRSGTCWIAPSLSNVEEDEDWTVYRPIMTLKEAQEEDALEMSRWRIGEYMEKKTFIPMKEVTSHSASSKAKPLKHLWRYTKPLPKPPKSFNYAELYKTAREKQRRAEEEEG